MSSVASWSAAVTPMPLKCERVLSPWRNRRRTAAACGLRPGRAPPGYRLPGSRTSGAGAGGRGGDRRAGADCGSRGRRPGGSGGRRLAGEEPGPTPQRAPAPRREACIAQGDCRREAMLRHRREPTSCSRSRTHRPIARMKRLQEAVIRPVENEGRMADERDQPAGDDRRRAGEPLVAGPGRDEFVHEGAALACASAVPAARRWRIQPKP